MSAKAKKATPTKKIQVEQVISGFDAERLKAPFLLRCGSLLIDYILVISVPVGSLLLSRFFGYDGAKLLNSEVSNTGWLITILLCITNFIIFPMFSGQSIGKMLTGLRIAKMDGSMPGFFSLILRHTIGYLLTIFTGGLGYLFSLLNKKGRTLHDFLGGTMVVYGKKFVKKDKVVKEKKETKKLKKKTNLKAQKAKL